jgi:hypothetical protein
MNLNHGECIKALDICPIALILPWIQQRNNNYAYPLFVMYSKNIPFNGMPSLYEEAR